MNWQRGLFRIWLLLSVLWIGVASAITYFAYSNISLQSRGLVFHPGDERLAPVFQHDLSNMVAASARGEYRRVSFDEMPAVHLFLPPDTPETIVEQRTQEARDLGERLERLTVTPRRNQTMQTGLLMGLLPPLGLLLIGASAIWAARGFRQRA